MPPHDEVRGFPGEAVAPLHQAPLLPRCACILTKTVAVSSTVAEDGALLPQQSAVALPCTYIAEQLYRVASSARDSVSRSLSWAEPRPERTTPDNALPVRCSPGSDKTVDVMYGKAGKKSFTFDGTFDESTSQARPQQHEPKESFAQIRS